MSAELLLILSWVLAFLVGVDIGGKWCAWVTRRAARRVGIWEQLERSLEHLADPRNWRNP